MSIAGPDPTLCPACGQPTGGGPVCQSCGVSLVGPVAAELWEVDVRLAGLQRRRAELLAQLRSTEASTPGVKAPPPYSQLSAPTWTPPVRKEWTPARVQNTLLSLGVLLLAVAALVATAVAYRNVGATGRALVLLLVTAAAVAASALTRRRGLTASAEATAALSVVLALVSARALRRAGFADQLEARTFWTWATALVALAALALSRWGQAFGLGAVLVGQVPLIITAARHDGAAVSGVLTAQVALLGTGIAVLRRRPGRTTLGADPVGVVLLVSAAVTALVSAGFAGSAAYPDSGPVRAGVLALAGLAVVLAGAALVLPDLGVGRELLTAAATGLGLLALAAPAHARFTPSQLAAVVAVSALLVAIGAGALPDPWRAGPAVASAVASAVALTRVLPAVAQAVVGPFTWLDRPWALGPASSARSAVSVADRWDGRGGVALVLLLVAASAFVFAVLARRTSWSSYPVAALGVLTVVVTPLAVDTTYRVALAWDLSIGCAALLLGPSLRRRSLGSGYACSAVGVGLLALACVWSVADERASTVVLAAAALVCAVAAWLDGLLDAALSPVLAGLAAALLGAEVFAISRSAGAPLDRSGFHLTVVACLLAATMGRLRPRQSDGLVVELVGVALLGAALVATSGDPGWTSWTLALGGLTALAVALRPERRPLSYAGALLLSASSWVRLADAHVHAPEPYVVPLAVLALGLGLLRRRSDREVSSWAAYGPALSLGLLPSLVASLDDTSARRPLLLAVAATTVVVVGALRRLQAPLALGSTVLAVDAVRQLGAYVALVPRWVVIAALGLLLLVLGGTFERRRAQAQRVRAAFDRMS